MRRGCLEGKCSTEGSLDEPAQVKSVTSAHTRRIADAELTSFEFSKGLGHATDQRTVPYTRQGARQSESEGIEQALLRA